MKAPVLGVKRIIKSRIPLFPGYSINVYRILTSVNICIHLQMFIQMHVHHLILNSCCKLNYHFYFYIEYLRGIRFIGFYYLKNNIRTYAL